MTRLPLPRFLVLILVGVLFAGLPPVGSSRARTLSRGPEIAFCRGDFGMQQDIFTISPSGQALRRVTTSPSFDCAPAWSPDGRQIAYQCRGTMWAYRGGDLCIVNADGSRLRRLTDTRVTEADPTWSPDGKRLAFVRYLPGSSPEEPNAEIFSIRTNGTDEKRLTNHPRYDTRPDWSPDGDKIAFSTYPFGGLNQLSPTGLSYRSGIYVMDADGSKQVPVTVPDGDISPAWSPDGSRIAFSRFEDDEGPTGSWNVYILDVHTLIARSVGDAKNANGIGASWSPDGRHLVVADLVNHNTDGLFILKADGSSRRRLLYSGWGEFSPDWKPQD